VKHYGLDSEPRAELFMPAWQQPLNGMSLIVRTASDPKPFVDSIRRVVLAIDAEQPIYDTSTMADVVSRSVFLPRISTVLLTAFAASALLLALLGIYGVVSYSVAQRTKEIGIRLALGAQTQELTRMFVSHGARLAALGVVCGLAAAALLMRLLSTLLFEVRPVDPVTYTVAAGTLVGAALLASYLPALRAAGIDPVQALRSE
jgi:ABC-type antimicrobial peptide transport system permease subunit